MIKIFTNALRGEGVTCILYVYNSFKNRHLLMRTDHDTSFISYKLIYFNIAFNQEELWTANALLSSFQHRSKHRRNIPLSHTFTLIYLLKYKYHRYLCFAIYFRLFITITFYYFNSLLSIYKYYTLIYENDSALFKHTGSCRTVSLIDNKINAPCGMLQIFLLSSFLIVYQPNCSHMFRFQNINNDICSENHILQYSCRP